MPEQRTPLEKTAITVAVGAVAWVIGVALFYRSGDINPAGIVPTSACFLALWGAVRADTTIMWSGTVLALITVVLFTFSVGWLVAPSALALVFGSIALSRHHRVSGVTRESTHRADP